MKHVALTSILLILNWIDIKAIPKYSADISYMVTDFKYSKERGLKICEVQHGALSAMKGDLCISGGNGIISPAIAEFFTRFPLKKWAIGLLYAPLKRCLANKEWALKDSFQKLTHDAIFLEDATQHPRNPYVITDYSSIVYADFDIHNNFDFYKKSYPGILFMNAPTFPYWQDKYKMNLLFDYNDELKKYKADWRLYPKKYHALLSYQIEQDMPSEMYVIKPRGEFLGNGVIVVTNTDLDHVLQMILQPDASLKKHPDKKYAYWKNNKDDSFLIEKYYESDYVCFSRPLSETTSDAEYHAQYHYDATMRMVFILQYDGENMSYHCLGGFAKLPCKALEEEGTLNEARTSCGLSRCYAAINPELFAEINVHMERAMLMLYEIMLNE